VRPKYGKLGKIGEKSPKNRHFQASYSQNEQFLLKKIFVKNYGLQKGDLISVSIAVSMPAATTLPRGLLSHRAKLSSKAFPLPSIAE